MKFLKIGSNNDWYYGSENDLVPVLSVELDNECLTPQILITTYDGDKKPNKPFGDEITEYLEVMDVDFLNIEKDEFMEQLKDMIETENFEDAIALLKIMKLGLL